ncbi:MAG: 30S ribosomal protein S20 [Actinomycetota bacterium]|nr:30S ribosomal protein S20 [Actinomycetota bacterium]
MANIASQRKRNVRTDREQAENRRFTSAVKTHFKRLESAVAEGDSEAADAEHRALVSKVDKAVQKGALHRRSGARKKSRAARLRAGSSS